MKLATTTADFIKYTDTPPALVQGFEGTGFRLLDLNLSKTVFPESFLLNDRWTAWFDELGEAAAALEIAFCQAHGPTGKLHTADEAADNLLRATIRSIEGCARLGIPHLIVHPQDIGGFPSRDQHRLNLEKNRAFFEKLFPVMEQTGVGVLIENSCDSMAPTRNENIRHFSSTAAELLELAEFIDHPLLHICWDTGHANMQGVDQYRSIMELGDRLRGIHVADNFGDADSHLAPFQGTTNFDAVMRGLLDSGYRGTFTFESSQLLRDGKVWPHTRRPFLRDGKPETRLMDVPLSLKREAIKLLYQIGKHILSAYDCFEA